MVSFVRSFTRFRVSASQCLDWLPRSVCVAVVALSGSSFEVLGGGGLVLLTHVRFYGELSTVCYRQGVTQADGFGQLAQLRMSGADKAAMIGELESVYFCFSLS